MNKDKFKQSFPPVDNFFVKNCNLGEFLYFLACGGAVPGCMYRVVQRSGNII